MSENQTTICAVCGGATSFQHEHRPDCSGLDDGPELRPAKRKPAPKAPEVLAAIRARAWGTRRAKYGERGHG